MAAPYRPAKVRFWEKVALPNENGCMLWLASTRRGGYGQFGLVKPRVICAHRFAYELAYGPIGDGLVIDHLCRNPLCVNPEHLEAVSPRENIVRGEAAASKRRTRDARTECRRGHALDDANTYIRACGKRMCRTCHRMTTAARRARLRRT